MFFPFLNFFLLIIFFSFFCLLLFIFILILETILWAHSFIIVWVLGSCCLGVGLCQLLPCMLSNVIISTCIHSLLPHLLRTLVLCFTWCLLLSLQLFTLHKRWSPSLGCQVWSQLGLTPGTSELQSGILSIELPHPTLSYHIPLLSYHIPFCNWIHWIERVRMFSGQGGLILEFLLQVEQTC